MAENFAAKQAEAVLGHGDQNRAAHTDISNPDREGGKYADESGEKMKALVWMGKNDVRVGMGHTRRIYKMSITDGSQLRRTNLRLLMAMMQS